MLEGSLLAGMAFANAGSRPSMPLPIPGRRISSYRPWPGNSVMLLPVLRFNLLGTCQVCRYFFGFRSASEDLTDRQAAEEAWMPLRN
jgi:hypothetical protein